MFCKNCGKEINDDVKFCTNCGNSITEETKIADIPNDASEDMNKNSKSYSNKKVLIIGIIVGIIIIITIITGIILIILNNGMNFKNIYDKVLKQDKSYYKFLSIASDNSYIEIDTNPYDIDDYASVEAFKLVKTMNKELGFSEALENKMSHTRAIDGKQSDKTNSIEVTWTYHPNKGLEIQYTKLK